MPGKGHLPDLQERILRGLKANTNRTAGGLGSNASPGMTRDRMAAMRRGAPASGATVVRASKVDWFEIPDDSESSFTLTYIPVRDSWNVQLNSETLDDEDEDEFQIVGKTLTITDPANSFLAADAQGTPWKMRVQYDYLTGVPSAPVTPATFPQSSDAGLQEGAPTVEFDTAPEAGSSVLLIYRPEFGSPPSVVSGLGATWTEISGEAGAALWLGTGCNGVGTLITTNGDCFWIGIVEVTTALTAVGAQTVDSAGGHLLELTAAGAGVAICASRSGIGLGNTPAAGSWAQVGNGNGGGATLRTLAFTAGSGEALDVHTNGVTPWDYGLLALVRYA